MFFRYADNRQRRAESRLKRRITRVSERVAVPVPVSSSPALTDQPGSTSTAPRSAVESQTSLVQLMLPSDCTAAGYVLTCITYRSVTGFMFFSRCCDIFL